MQSNERNSVTFKTAYEALNSLQRKAVDTIEGPVMVVAGPGTGKTQILTLRIANILVKTDTKPENILALTFTEAGARAMRKRLRSFIGEVAYRVPIYTFHGFADSLIQAYPEAYPKIIGGRPARDIEKINFIETILDNPSYKVLRPRGNPAHYVPDILSAISALKKEYVTPDMFAERITLQAETLAQIERVHTKGAHKGKVRGEYREAEKFLLRNQELLMVYREYEALLKTERRYDFEDMIIETVKAFETDENMLRDVQETYQYILADEHQDVNGSQNRILECVADYHSSPNLFVVGDEKQAIYRFQGASLENFLFFETKYPQAEIISLTDNYRSAQVILDLAQAVVATDDPTLSALRVPLLAKNTMSPTLSRSDFSDEEAENASVVSSVKTYLEAGVPPHEIAVIVRQNREVEEIAMLLKKHGITVAPSAERDVLQHPVMTSIRTLISAVTVRGDEAALVRVLHEPCWGITAGDLVRILSARTFATPLSDILASQDILHELGVVAPESLHNVYRVLECTRKLQGLEAPHQVLGYLLVESGFIARVLSHDPVGGGGIVRRLYNEVESLVREQSVKSLADIESVLTTLENHKLPLATPAVAGETDAVAVLTAHKSKGLEFEAVILPHLNDSVWRLKNRQSLFRLPIMTTVASSSADAREDDERRLLYVAITRAKRVLALSCAHVNVNGKEQGPSVFLDALPSTLLPTTLVTPVDRTTAVLEALVPAPVTPLTSDFLRTYLDRRGLSATAFNNYVQSPWEFVYKNVLRIPTLKTPEQHFGTAFHSVLDRVVRTYRETDNHPSNTHLKQWLEEALSKLALSATDYVRLHERGLAALVVCVPSLLTSLTPRCQTEFPIKVILKTNTPEYPELLLTGNLDRIDFDSSGLATAVIDYKTGSPKSRAVIEGKTKGSTGNYKRQLVFYALLLSLHDDERLHTRTMTLNFVEPDKKTGAIRTETFIITDEEIESLKRDIIKATREIVSGECLSFECDETKTTYCSLVAALQKNI